MNKTLSATAAAILLVAGLSVPASAKEKHHSAQSTQGMTQGSARTQTGTTGQAVTGGNAAMSGNNGNSAGGSNAIPNVKGGDSGSGR